MRVRFPPEAHMNIKPMVVAIVGSTSSGKTSLSIEIAKQFSGEVISADSRQVYKELDIGTGKVTKDEMAGVKHHLLSIVDPTEVYTANDFVRDAKAALHDIVARKKLPIVAGGTFFYLDLLRGTMQAAPVEPDPDFRNSIEHYTNEELLELLRTKDRRRAEAIDPNNRRRLVRALEIIETLGETPKQTNTESPYEWLVIGLEIDKDTLCKKFSTRLEDWLQRGLLEEVHEMRTKLPLERFLELGFEYTLTADYLDEKITKEEFFEQFVQKNWQYAKRQMTWLKRDENIEWFAPQNQAMIFNRVEKFLKS